MQNNSDYDQYRQNKELYMMLSNEFDHIVMSGGMLRLPSFRRRASPGTQNPEPKPQSTMADIFQEYNKVNGLRKIFEETITKFNQSLFEEKDINNVILKFYACAETSKTLISECIDAKELMKNFNEEGEKTRISSVLHENLNRKKFKSVPTVYEDEILISDYEQFFEKYKNVYKMNIDYDMDQYIGAAINAFDAPWIDIRKVPDNLKETAIEYIAKKAMIKRINFIMPINLKKIIDNIENNIMSLLISCLINMGYDKLVEYTYEKKLVEYTYEKKLISIRDNIDSLKSLLLDPEPLQVQKSLYLEAIKQSKDVETKIDSIFAERNEPQTQKRYIGHNDESKDKSNDESKYDLNLFNQFEQIDSKTFSTAIFFGDENAIRGQAVKDISREDITINGIAIEKTITIDNFISMCGFGEEKNPILTLGDKQVGAKALCEALICQTTLQSVLFSRILSNQIMSSECDTSRSKYDFIINEQYIKNISRQKHNAIHPKYNDIILYSFEITFVFIYNFASQTADVYYAVRFIGPPIYNSPII